MAYLKKLIVYVHGALSTRRSFSHIVRQGTLTESFIEGEVAERFFSYDVRKEPANATIERLAEQVKKTGVHDVTFIGHSFGGVVSVGAARLLSDDFKPKVISLATPYGGSSVASLLKVFRPASQFFDNVGRYGSFMRDFNSKALPCRVRGIVTTAGGAEWIAGENDGVVSVSSQLHYEKDLNWSGVKLDANHFEVLLVPKTIELIKKELMRA